LLFPSVASAQAADDVAPTPPDDTSAETAPAPETTEGASDAAEATPKPPPPPPAPAPAKPAPKPTAPEPPPAPAIIGVERVPDSGYPGPATQSTQGILEATAGWDWHVGRSGSEVRGLHGGSMWLAMHGLQWPYLPRRPGEPALMLALSGSGWVDTAYERIESGLPANPGIKYLRQQGRLVLRATPTYRSEDWFVQGQAELVANSDQSVSQPQVADTDDLWVRAGYWNAFDVQFGRFEGWELYHLGMGLDINTFERRGALLDGSTFKPPDFYGVTFAFYRPDGAGNFAVHGYPAKWLRLEALTRVGNDSGSNKIGERGAAILDFGWVKLKGGTEYVKGWDSSDNTQGRTLQRGGGGAIQFVLDPYLEFGVNAAWAIQDAWDSTGAVSEDATWTLESRGAFANLRLIGDLLAGGGINYTYFENIHRDAAGNVQKRDHTQVFGALQYGLMKQLFLKVVVAWADAYYIPNALDNNIPPFHDKMFSTRLRASLYF
jgi:hypothetical protein